MAAVSAARAAAASVVSLLAQQLIDDRVLVNAVNLGVIDTERQRARYAQSGSDASYESWLAAQARTRSIPLGRVGQPAEVAPWVLLLLSPLSSYVTGTATEVAGGLGAW